MAATQRIFGIARARPTVTWEDMVPVMQVEAAHVWSLYEQNVLREAWVRTDALGAVYALETTPEESARLLSALPMAGRGLVDFELVPVGPFTPLSLLFGTQAHPVPADHPTRHGDAVRGRVLALGRLGPNVKPGDLAPHLADDARLTWGLWKGGLIRENYLRTDRPGAALMLEAADVAEAGRVLARLPLMQAGLIAFECLSLAAFMGFDALLEGSLDDVPIPLTDPTVPTARPRLNHITTGDQSMSHKNLNPVNANRPKRAAIVISNPAVSTTTGWPVGFWWAELAHPYFHFTEAGWEVDVYSPNGGNCEADAMSDPEDASQWQAEDVISRGYKHDPEFVKLIENTKPVDGLNVEDYDVMVVAGGQGPMFTFEKAENLQRKFAEFYESGKVTAALCHGTAILRYVKLSDGEPLVRGRTVTGFANIEEDFADHAVWDAGALDRDKHVMPWRIEDEVKKLGANYVQAGLWKGFAIRDGNLVTGQQNFSGAEVAQAILEAVGR